jgi:TonB family protein
LVLILALAAGCGAPPAAQSPAQPASEGPTGSASPEPTTSAPPEPKPAAPPPDAQAPAAATPVEAPPPRATSRPDGNVRPGAATATGTLGGNISESQVRDVVEKHGELFDECYKIGVKSSPKFTGKVTVKATIGPTGRVNRADVVRSTAKNQQVDRCVADTFEKMQFPSPQGGVTTVITFPIEFSGVELVQP